MPINKNNSQKQQKKVTKNKKVNQVTNPFGIAYVYSGYNNTLVSITDSEGNAVCWESGGRSSFKGSRKATPYAATIIGENAAKDALSAGLKEVEVRMKGVGSGKSQCVKALRNAGLGISKIVDVTPLPHNGCRPRKRRRV